jgi:hypothetical protein
METQKDAWTAAREVFAAAARVAPELREWATALSRDNAEQAIRAAGGAGDRAAAAARERGVTRDEEARYGRLRAAAYSARDAARDALAIARSGWGLAEARTLTGHNLTLLGRIRNAHRRVASL